MSSLLNQIHFWTTQEDVITKHSFYGAFKYYSKKESFDQTSKKVYCEQRGVLWNPVNRRQNKLKDRLKELEDNLIQNKVINYFWQNNNLELLLSTGLIVNIEVNEQSGDVVRISFDKQLSIKLQVNIICDGIILGPQVICICNDGHVLGYGGTWKDGWLLEGGPRRRIHSHSDWLVVWGRPGSEHPQPWSPLAKDHQRANLHLYWLGLRGPELLAYKNTDGEPFIVLVSKIFEQTIILVEQKVTQRGAVSVEVSTLELSGNSLKTVAITAVPLQTQVSCCKLSSNEGYLLICCIDSTLALLDRNTGSTKTVKASFIPTLCAWQKQGALIAICNERGQIQYYDVALNCVKSQVMSEDDMPSVVLDMTGYFHSQVSVVSLNWDSTNLLVALEQGPIICVTHIPKSLSFISISKRYINMCEIKKAIALLLSWNFGEDAFFILQKIVSYLLKRPMTEEVAQQLKDALGCYHASVVPLSAEVRHQYGNQVFSLTRRYFHQLVRAGMYETAFLLAVDVVHHDLFMDLHYIAVKIGETEMAAAARAQASALVSRCSSEASNCSHSSCSECSSTCENDNKEKPSHNEASNSAPSVSPLDTSNDNMLSTNFNQPETPKTYLTPSGAYEFPKINPPRVNYVKPPQVPANFNKSTPSNIPPLPFNFSMPNLLSSNLGIPLIGSVEAQNNFGQFQPTTLLKHPHVPTNKENTSADITSTNFTGSSKPLAMGVNAPFNFGGKSQANSFTNLQSSGFRGNSQSMNLFRNTLTTNFGENMDPINSISNSKEGTSESPTLGLGSTNSAHAMNVGKNIQSSNFVRSNFIRTKPLSMERKMSLSQNFHRSSFVPSKPIFAPPLPVTNTSNILQHFPPQKLPPQVPPSKVETISTSFSSTSPLVNRRHQSKVKFSDTVTAFIVPEVKRPVRPAPPPHVTDPQKELADSLPLCHPNEDYLKDFALVRQNENSGENKDPPKIKVVHFGVV
ncbi:hypothetical protein HHI36_009618 [Cryptolaemus montrouzieri]|uniref:WD repeat-containing and planar cell polarity effector protein fritz n=1 Tax=Cryptolaemus montrouzieri TaxID=559131 RepID=A0ABD2MGC4_9CUCU